MQKSEAEAAREQLLELLDERHEAGPTNYVLQRATAEAIGDDDWGLVVVVRPSLLAPTIEHTFSDVTAGPAGPAGTPEGLAWQVYQALEDGQLTR